eukprot:TRINITY_DN13355_c0_g1_i3.p1 TRINITY_DN13355_c0_g1~~TRINITY_DN13355_c0_g1_i3.p1  ORF type:complete len:432 (+),score=68.00 TRINITY_DN13355_c0_g1_i3:62-1297(+)
MCIRDRDMSADDPPLTTILLEQERSRILREKSFGGVGVENNGTPLTGEQSDKPSEDEGPERGCLRQMIGFMCGPIDFISEKFRSGSMKGCIFTLISATLGAGVLALPSATLSSGFLLTIAQIIICAMLGYLTTYLLTACAQKTNLFTYFDLANHTYGTNFRMIVKLVFLICNWSYAVSYLILINNFVATALKDIYPNSESLPSYLTDPRGFFWQTIAAYCFALPLSLKRKITSLIFWCLLGFGCIVYIILAITVKATDPDVTNFLLNFSNHWTDIKLSGFYDTFSTCIYAYTCHPNVLEVYSELERRTKRRMSKILLILMSTCALLYVSCGGIGYFTFADKPEVLLETHGNILLADYKKALIIQVGILLLSVSLIPAMPLSIKPAKDSLLDIISPGAVSYTHLTLPTIYSV